MSKYKHILFDLDGTIIDSAPGIINSIMYAIDQLGFPPVDPDALRVFIGPPLQNQFKEYLHLTDEQGEYAVQCFKDYYRRRGIQECSVFPGVGEMLHYLETMGYKLYIATSKPEKFARQILTGYALDHYFTFIGGSEMDEKTRANKAEVIEYVLKENYITELHEVLMIGDRMHDIEGAKICGLEAMGILYGYGSKEEFEDAGADYIVTSTQEIVAFLSE